MLTRCCKCISCTCRANNIYYLFHLSTFLQLILEKLHILMAVRFQGFFFIENVVRWRKVYWAQLHISNVFIIIICPLMEAVKGGCTGYSGRSCSTASYTVQSIPAQIPLSPSPPPQKKNIRLALPLLCCVESTQSTQSSNGCFLAYIQSWG